MKHWGAIHMDHNRWWKCLFTFYYLGINNINDYFPTDMYQTCIK